MIVSLSDATPQQAGGKAAVLGQLIRAGFPVPPGFVVPVDVYRAVTSGLSLRGLGPDDVRRLIASQPLPSGLLDELADAMTQIGENMVAVRSSGSNEDTAVASAAGLHDSFLGVTGAAAVAERLPAVWASMWTPRAVAYRTPSDASPEMAVIVQRHINADVAGVLFTGEPRTVIEASWGLGESVVRGLVTPDNFTVTRHDVLERRTGDKQTRIDGTVTSQVRADDRGRLCLDDRQLLRLAQLGHEVAESLGGPQDIEFAVENDQVWLLQARPITASLPTAAHTGTSASLRGTAASLRGTAASLRGAAGSLRGTAGSPGVAEGAARVVRGPEDFNRIGPGDILVCRFTDPAWTPLFGVVAGVVTETGGLLSHAAIVAREHRIPAVLGVPNAMTTLHDGQAVTLDGNTGTVQAIS
ncbi:pyruvate,water dikinase [Kribbella antiqua]|uniref:Pyruvate,water dikinase n=1 Tax=Kribbella antiqua TaxID=2512217 RepID=A0A4R2J123_9ACTN|nr:PEP/pyruvate-binding domain-containing protein [Kribbella antiqua]TCO51843.1 pyruvate,water dikinase [Kribbella antiqua]